VSVTAIIPHYWHSREGDLIHIVSALREGSVAPAEILIWNNTERLISVASAAVINAGRNFGTAARFAAAYLARTEYVLFQDNDLVVRGCTLENMLRAIAGEPEGTSIELQGRMLVAPPSRYGGSEYRTNVDQVVDVGLSRLSLMTRSTAVSLCGRIPPDVIDDDLWVSHFLRIKLIPYGEHEGCLNLPEREGLSKNVAEHIGRRDRLVEQLWSR
jgi:hypothetical protein